MRTRARAVAALLASTLVALTAVAGCSVPHAGGSAISDVSACASVLPLAHQTVHGHGTLVLVHRLGRDDAASIYRELGAPPLPPAQPGHPAVDPTAGPSPPKTCVVVYRGTYPPGSVTGVVGHQAGHYALVVLRVRHPVVYRVLLTDSLPATLPGT